MKKNVLPLKEAEVEKLWEALNADKDVQFLFNNEEYPIIYNNSNFRKAARDIWVGMDLAEPRNSQTIVLFYNNGNYTLEILEEK